MNDAKWMLRLGSAAVVFTAVAAGAVVVARTPYQLRVRVVDAQGVLSGAWVALGERDVVVTDEKGTVVFTGRRYALDSALLTVTDPRLEPAHLSKTLRAEVSWVPWVRGNEMKIMLPIIPSPNAEPVASESEISDSATRQDFSIDLPTVTAPLLPEVTGLNEEELLDVSAAATFGLNPNQWVSLSKSLEQGRTSVWTCIVAGFSDSVCQASVLQNRVPLIRLAESETIQSDQLEQKQISLGQIRETELEAKRPESVTVVETRTSVEPSGGLAVDKPLRIETFFEGKPLQGAVVYTSRLKDNRVRELGETRADGSLQAKIPAEFWGETVTVFHDCCAPRSFPAKLSRVGGEPRLRLDLQSGTGVGVLVQQEAYGYLRKIPQFEISSNLGKLAVSGQDGFAMYNTTKTPEQQPSKVVVRKARPAEFFVRPDDIPGLQSRPMNFLVAAEEPYLPALALLEKNEGRSFQGVLKSSSLRRWRRDFMARLMQQSSIKTVVSGEVQARISAAGESATDLVVRGWQQTHLAGEWDFALSIDYNDSEQSLRLAASSPDGRIFFEKESHFGKDGTALPERISRQFFQNFLDSFPFEAHILKQVGDFVEISFPSMVSFGLRDSTPLALFQQSATPGDTRLSELAALAVVTSGEEGQPVRARITHWNGRVRKTRVLPDVVKAVKVSQEFYKREAARNAMAKSATSGSGKAL